MTERTTLRRREVGVAAAVALSGLAGCLVGFGGSPTDVDVTLTNETDERYDVAVLVELRDEALLDRTVTLQPSGVVEDSFETPEEAGDGTLSVSVEDGESTASDLRIGAGTGLASMEVVVRESGEVETSVVVR